MKISIFEPVAGLRSLLGACALVILAVPALASETVVTYNVAAGATSKPILVPAVNTPVSMTCVQNQVGFRGVGQATILRIGAVPPKFLEWVGMDIATSAVTSNFSNTQGVHIIYCDFTGKTVDLQVYDQNNIQIQNTGSTRATGVITFIW
jgi:hypothetical protein